MIPLLIVLGLLVVIVIAIVGIYNGLVRLRNQVKEAWAQVDVQLKRRFDLIPNLMETVKGYMNHERETLEAVTQARAAVAGAGSLGDRAEAEGMLGGAGPALRGGRELSRPQGQPELPGAAGGADQHREQDRLRAPVLQPDRDVR